MADSARDIIDNFLRQYGLEGLGDWAWDMYTGADGGPGASFEEIKLALPSQPKFQERFPAYDELAKRGAAITPDKYIEYEKEVAGYLQFYGVPAGMYDTPQGIAGLLLNDVSKEEVRARLSIAADAAFAAPQEVRDALRDRYGVNDGDLIGFYLDPDKALPVIQQQYLGARVVGAAQQQGVNVETATADRLAAQGVTYEQARQGFGTVVQLRDLTAQEQGGAAFNQDQLVGAAFGDATSSEAVSRETARRAARYRSAEGGAASGQGGVSGLRSARS